MASSVHNQKVQVLRALAIVAVVFIHTCPEGMSQVMFRPFVNFGVGLFLFLSGWLTSIECADWKLLIRKRIFRVMVPYVLWTVLYTLQKGTPDRLVFNLMTTRASSALYYVFVYVQFVLLTPLLARLARSRFRWVGFVFAPASVALCVYLPMIFGFDCGKIGEIAWNVCCLGWFTFYYLGLLLGNGCTSVVPAFSSERQPCLFVLLAISIVLQVMEGYLWYRFGWPNCGSQLKLTSLLTTTSVLLLAHAWLRRDYSPEQTSCGQSDKSMCATLYAFMKYVGNVSFGIYLVHIPMLRFLQSTSWYTDVPFGLNTLLVFALTSLAVALLSRITDLVSPRLASLIGLR